MAPVKILGEDNIWRNVAPTNGTRAQYIALSSAANRVVFARTEEMEVIITSRNGQPRRIKIDAPKDDVDLMEAIESARVWS